MNVFSRLLVVVMILASATARAYGAATNQFYSQRTLTLIVGFNPGGAYDLYARAVADHLGKHIPGSPKIVLQYMPGAGSVIAANYLYREAPKDGSTIALLGGTAPLEPLYGMVKTRFNPLKFNWLGSAAESVGVCFARHTSKIRTAEDLFHKVMITGAAGSAGRIMPFALNSLLGTRMKIVTGYKGSAGIMLALERGEIQGTCGMIYAAVKSKHPQWLKDGFVRPVLQIGLRRIKALPHVPFVMDFAKTRQARQELRVLVGWNIMGRPFVAPPGVPQGRVMLLRQAFEQTMKDRRFLAEAQRLRIDVTPIDSGEIESFLRSAYETPEPVIERVRGLLKAGR